MRLINKIVMLAAAVFTASAPAFATPTAVTPFVPQNPNSPFIATAADTAAVAADVANGNSVALTGHEMLLVNNSATTGSATVTITSAPDMQGRTGDITAYSILHGVTSVFGPFPVSGWQQSSDAKLHFSGSNASLLFTVIRLP